MPLLPGDDTGMAKAAIQVLAENLTALSRAPKAEFRTQREIGEKAKIDQRTVGRIMAGAHSAGVDKIEALAGVFKVQPWQLLYPGLESNSPPNVSNFSLAAKELARAYDALPDGREKQDLLAQLLGRLQMRHPAAEPRPSESVPSAEPRYSRAQAPRKRTGKSPARS